MYARYPNNKGQGRVKVPENYSGSMFSADYSNVEGTDIKNAAPEVLPCSEKKAKDGTDVYESKTEEGQVSFVEMAQKKVHAPAFGFDALRLFRGGFGFEELLLISLILLVSQGGGDDELILLLALLLFVR